MSLKLNPNPCKLLKVINDGLSLYATSETEREDDKQRMIKQLVMPTKPIVSSDCAHPNIAPPKSTRVEGNDSSRFCSFTPPDSQMIEQLVTPTKPIVSSDCAHPNTAPPKSASVEGNDLSQFCSFTPPDSQMIEQLVTPTKPIVSSDCAHPNIAFPKSASVEGNDLSQFCSFAPSDSAIVKGNDLYGIFNIEMLSGFIRKATVHFLCLKW